MYVVGLEVSTSAAKAALYSQQGQVITDYNKVLPPNAARITWQDPEKIYHLALDCLKQVAKTADGPILAIGLGGIWHSLLLLDKERKPLGPIQTWADLSGGDLTEVKQDQALAKWYYQKTGCLIHGMYPFWKLYGMQKEEQARLKKAAYISSQIEYLHEKLTRTSQVSASAASGSGLFNIKTASWDQELAEFAGIDLKMLARIVEAHSWAPLSREAADYCGLTQGIPVTVGSADGALNQIGSGAIGGNCMTFSVGTSGALRMTTKEPAISDNFSTWCYYLLDGWRLAGAATHAGSNLNWFMEKWGYTTADHHELAIKAQTLDITAGPYFLPFIFGERAPGWNENRMGGFLGLKGDQTEIHLYKAVLEGILFALYHSYLNLVAIGLQPNEIRLSGGIIKSPYWRQMAADIFGRSLTMTGSVHESTLGAALLALQAAGKLGHVAEFSPEITGSIEPDPKKHAVYQKRFERYLQLYNDLGR